MIKYIKMKIFMSQMKLALADMFEHGDMVIKLITELAISCKDLTGEDLRKEFISALATAIHEDNGNGNS